MCLEARVTSRAPETISYTKHGLRRERSVLFHCKLHYKAISTGYTKDHLKLHFKAIVLDKRTQGRNVLLPGLFGHVHLVLRGTLEGFYLNV